MSFIPRPLLRAGSNPSGNPGPSSDTDSERENEEAMRASMRNVETVTATLAKNSRL